jgi:hypothetical protein
MFKKHEHNPPPFAPLPEVTTVIAVDPDKVIIAEDASGINEPEPVELPSGEPFIPPLVIGDLDMCKLRDLLFSVRDQGVYCPMCRCPEFAQSALRSSHFEPCTIGEACEKLLRLYPKITLEVRWRK